MKSYVLAACLAGAVVAVPATAAEIVVPSDGYFTNPGPTNAASPTAGFDRWYANNVRNGGGVGVTDTYARNGKGSIEFSGPANAKADYEYYFSAANRFNLNSLNALSFDYLRGASSSAGAQYHPSLRLFVTDGTRSGYLVYEGIYNGQPTATVGGFVTNDVIGAKFWSTGSLPDAAARYDRTLNDWATLIPNLQVVGLSTGIGSGWNGSFAGAVDQITYGTATGSTTFNFDTAAAGGVPEPASWAMMIGGFGVVGGTLRRRKVRTTVSFA